MFSEEETAGRAVSSLSVSVSFLLPPKTDIPLEKISL